MLGEIRLWDLLTIEVEAGLFILGFEREAARVVLLPTKIKEVKIKR